MEGIGNDANSNYGPNIPFLLYFFFTSQFAAITPTIALGTLMERAKLSSIISFIVVWTLIVYCPIAHWMWNINGWAS